MCICARVGAYISASPSKFITKLLKYIASKPLVKCMSGNAIKRLGPGAYRGTIKFHFSHCVRVDVYRVSHRNFRAVNETATAVYVMNDICCKPYMPFDILHIIVLKCGNNGRDKIKANIINDNELFLYSLVMYTK